MDFYQRIQKNMNRIKLNNQLEAEKWFKLWL